MWADNETSEDLLGFKIHANLLIDVIKDDTVLPVTIGVFGDWGSGKSSILKILQAELSGKDDELKDETLVLYFNGWVFEGYDDAKAALLESIIEKFAKHKTLGNKVKDESIKLLKSVNWMRALGLGFKKVVLPGAAAYLTGGLSLVPYLMSEFSQLDKTELVDKLKGNDAEEFLKEILKKGGEEDSSMLVREFREDFKKLIEKSSIKKLVVIIDDLDRCTPERIIENLEAIKLFLNVEKTAFIIGADPRIVRHAIEHRYRTDRIENSDDPDSRNKRIISDYLEKLIQIPYILPKLSDNEVETYMALLFCKKELGDNFKVVHDEYSKYIETDRYGVFGLGNIQSVIDNDAYQRLTESVSLIASLSSIITEGLNGNPRQIKRFLNTFTLRNRLVKVAKISEFKIDILAKLMVLEYSAPDLFKKIYDWQINQNGEAKELIQLEEFSEKGDIEGIKNNYGIEWSSEKLLKWLKVDPKLSGVDLRDYFWISRDQLVGSLSGSSLIPPHIRILFKKLIEHKSGKILTNIVKTEILDKLSPVESQHLFTLLEKEVAKSPDNSNVHKVYIEMMGQNVASSMESYKRIIVTLDHNKIPFSLRSNFAEAEKNNGLIRSIYKLFDNNSQIYRAINNNR